MIDLEVADFPSGPLDVYRKKASFNWKAMLSFIDGEETLMFKRRVWKTLEDDALFARIPGEDISVDKHRELTFLRLRQLYRYNFLTTEEALAAPCKTLVLNDCLGMYDLGLGGKLFLGKE
ncbi:hypothetical protein XENORESO_014836, partial [Xenotaenia resolanae]